MPGFFENVHLRSPPSSAGMGELAGWQEWRCGCGRRWDLEHFHALDGRYLGCSWILSG